MIPKIELCPPNTACACAVATKEDGFTSSLVDKTYPKERDLYSLNAITHCEEYMLCVTASFMAKNIYGVFLPALLQKR